MPQQIGHTIGERAPNEDPATRPYHPPDLGHRRPAVANVVQRQEHQHQVAGPIGQRDGLGASGKEVNPRMRRRLLRHARICSDGSTPKTGPPNVSARSGANRPVPEPRSSTVNGLSAFAHLANTPDQTWAISADNARPAEYTAYCRAS